MPIIPWYVTLLRLVVPLTILRWPLFGILAANLADGSDWNLSTIASESDEKVYQVWDKAFDLYYWVFILWVIRKWKDHWAKNVAIFLFSFRLVGMMLFWLTDSRLFLFFFPNIFENFVMLCLILFWFSKKTKLPLDRFQKLAMLAVLSIPKLTHEYYLHYLSVQPWEIHDLGSWLGLSATTGHTFNVSFWISLFYVLPILGFLIYVWPTIVRRR